MKPEVRVQISAYIISATVTIAAIGAMIIVHEESGPFKDLLNLLTGHHWTTKSVLAVLLLVGVSLVMVRVLRNPRAARVLHAYDTLGWTMLLVGVTIAFSAASTIIYIAHYLD